MALSAIPSQIHHMHLILLAPNFRQLIWAKEYKHPRSNHFPIDYRLAGSGIGIDRFLAKPRCTRKTHFLASSLDLQQHPNH